jgi:DNA-binding protein Fis
MDEDEQDPMCVISIQLQHLFAAECENDLLNKIEHLIVSDAFRYCRFNQVHTASLLGISRNVLRTLLKRHGLLANPASSSSSKRC